MAGYEAGTAWLQIQPSFAGVVTSINSEVAKWGTQAGQTFSTMFKDTVERQTADTQAGPSDSETAKTGDSAGGKFADSFKARVAAALQSLPDATVGLDDEVAKLKLDDIRGRLLALSDANVGVDLSSADALAKLDVLKIDLDELALKSPDIRVKVDAAAAIAELEAVSVAAAQADGSGGAGGGLSGLASSGSGLGAILGPLAGGVAILATALIPIAGLAAGAAIGFTGMAVAATAGLGAFGLAALPVLTQVTTAYQQISADQTALSRATSTAQKNTAITHLQDDLNNLSPVVASVTLGLINAKNTMQNWSAQFSPLIIRVFNAALADLQPILNAITPLVTAGGNALVQFFKAIGQATQQTDFKNFIAWLATQVGPAMQTITEATINFAGAFSQMLQKSGPLIKTVEKGILDLSKAVEQWVTDGGFEKFLKWIETDGPKIAQDVITIVEGFTKLLIALEPIGKTILDTGASFVKVATDILVPAAQVIGKFTEFEGGVNILFAGIVLLRDLFQSAFGAIESSVAKAWAAIQPIISEITAAVVAAGQALSLLPGGGGSTPHPSSSSSSPPTGAAINHTGTNPAHNAAGTGMGTFQGLSWVGERGPELVNFGSPVQIIPNHDLAKLGGGSQRGSAPLIGTAHFHNEADIDVMTRKANFAFRAGVL